MEDHYKINVRKHNIHYCFVILNTTEEVTALYMLDDLEKCFPIHFGYKMELYLVTTDEELIKKNV